MNILLYNLENNDRMRFYEDFFDKAGFNVVGIFSNIENFDYGEYKRINRSELKEYDYEYIFTHNSQRVNLQNILIEEGISQEKIRVIYYDLNNVQKVLGNDNIKYLFYDGYSVENNKLKHYLKYKNLRGKYTDKKSLLTDVKKDEIAHDIYISYKKQKKDVENVPLVYQSGDNWRKFMKMTRQEFYEAVEKDDEATIIKLLQNFFRNCMSTGIWGGKEEYENFLKNNHIYWHYFDCFKVWMAKTGNDETNIDTLGMSPEANPYGILINDQIVNINSFLFHARATMCKNLLSDEKRAIVAEIGGGTGLLGYYLNKVSDNITYIDFDLPDNLICASYYLKASFPEKKVLLYDSSRTLTREELLTYDIVLMPNYMVSFLEERSIDMFVNTISFGEMSYEAVCEYYSQIERVGKKYFYHENLFAPQGEYECYPTAVYPRLNNYKQLHSTASSWPMIFDSFNRNYLYVEQLYERID